MIKGIQQTLLSGGFVAIMLGMFPTLTHAVGFNIFWTDNGNVTMTGMFSFNDSLTGIIDETNLDAFSIEVFENGASQGTWTANTAASDFGIDPGALEFNFNFNATTGLFLVGDNSASSEGQQWNGAGTIGFISGSAAQQVSYNNTFSQLVPIEASTLTATPKSTEPIPEPATFILFGSGMIGIWGYAARRQRHAKSTAQSG